MSNQKPTFLIILCILTFIFSGKDFYGSIKSYNSPESKVSNFNEFLDIFLAKMEEDPEAQKSIEIIESKIDEFRPTVNVINIKNWSLISLISSILFIIGAILMWGLNKKGYWIYASGFAVLFISALLIFKGIIGIGFSIVVLIMAIVMLILYGLNLKHMS